MVEQDPAQVRVTNQSMKAEELGKGVPRVNLPAFDPSGIKARVAGG